MSKGGRTSTSWPTGSSWHHGKTTTIRVPAALADKILQYARTLDLGVEKQNIAFYGSDVFLDQQIILQALESYIDYKRQHYHPNQNAKNLDTGTRAWDELRKFKSLIENHPLVVLKSPSFETVVCAPYSNP